MVAPGVSRTATGSRVEMVVAKSPPATTKERRHKEGIKTKQEDGETSNAPTTITKHRLQSSGYRAYTKTQFLQTIVALHRASTDRAILL